MHVSEALDCLGSKRVIWIDDCFNDTPAQLARMLVNSLEVAKACGFPELHDAIETYDFDPTGAEASITQILTDVGPQRAATIKAAFFEREGNQNQFPTGELSASTIEKACGLLGVNAADRWTFGKADRHLTKLCTAGDMDISYIVDLNEAGGSKNRGAEILRALWDNKSAGTAFILTHETDTAGESQKEAQLRKMLASAGGNNFGIPICVIAKERLSPDADAADTMEEALNIGIKRAGLRRSVHEVLSRAGSEIEKAFNEAAIRMLSVPPEQLEAHVFERGYKEGVSELHVVERALTAHIAQNLRAFFGGDEAVQRSARRLRALRNIKLKPATMPPDENLMGFRQAEVWESDALINSAFAPISCGDVFETDAEEKATRTASKKFLLLAQPCDISLRPDESKRALDTAFLVPLRRKTVASTGNPKLPYLPFKLSGEQWACDFRNAAVVKLSVLDLASFRADGRVRVDEAHIVPEGILVAQKNVYKRRTAAATIVLQRSAIADAAGSIDASLQLSFSAEEDFKYIHTATFEPASKIKANGVTTSYPKRVTWRLRRCGRVRMPYAAALLSQYVGVMSRQAFDMDYINPGFGDGEVGMAQETIEQEVELEAPIDPAADSTPRSSGKISEAGRKLSRWLLGR